MNETKLGINVFSGREIVVSDSLRQSGFYVIGKQGVGKSSFISHLIWQDIVKGYPVFVVDPHGDLITDVIYQMPDEAVKRTYLLDLEDTDYPFSVNLFALGNEEAKDIKLRQKGIDRILRVCERLFPGDARMMLERVLRVVVQTLTDNSGCSMGDIPALLYDEKFRSRLVKNTSRRVREYWENIYNALPPSSRNREVKPLDNRISSLLDNPMLENIVAQKTTSIDFRKSIDAREIILIKLPVQEYSVIAPIIGTVLIAEIYRSTFSFRDTQLEHRIGFSLFVDEFQNFSTRDFSELFTQGRKFGSRLLVGHQYREQLTDDNKSSTITAPTIVSFNVIHSNARELSTSFVDQAAIIREPVVYPDVLKHLSEHPSEHVQSFLRSYIEPLKHRSKEPFNVALPASYPRFENYASFLAFLEKIMYLVQTDGFLIGEDFSPPVKDMFSDFERICSFLYGFSDYYAYHFYKRNPKREKLEVEAQKKIDLLSVGLEEKKRVVESNEAFLAFFDFPHNNNALWHDKDAALEAKRMDLKNHLRSFLLLDDYDLGGESPLPSFYGWRSSDKTNWFGLDAEYNKLLAPYSSVDKLLAMKRIQREKLLAKRVLDLKNYRSELVRVNRQKTRPFQSIKTSQPLYNRGHELERLIVMREEEIARLEKCLAESLVDARSHEAEEIASVCAHFATLDSPQKVIERKKDLYTQGEINPLLEQIALVKEKLAKALEALDEQFEREKVVCDRFVKSLWGCMAALSTNPIVEQQTLTPNDTTHILEHLDARHALVHTERGENGDCTVFAIKTLDAPSRVEASVFATRLDDIVDRTRKKYCRPRYEVEEELEAKKALLEDEDIDSDYGDDDFEGGSDLMRFDD